MLIFYLTFFIGHEHIISTAYRQEAFLMKLYICNQYYHDYTRKLLESFIFTLFMERWVDKWATENLPQFQALRFNKMPLFLFFLKKWFWY